MRNVEGLMDESERVNYRVEGKVAYITLNRPETLNAVDLPMQQLLVRMLQRFDLDDDAWVAILHGEGRAFSSGADIKQRAHETSERERLLTWSMTPPEGFLGRCVNWKPVIAAVHGHCLGLAFRLALQCDVIVASEDAQFGATETLIGLPGSTIWSGLQCFMPSKVATEMLLTGRSQPASILHRIGLVNRVVPNGEHLAAAAEFAKLLLAPPPLTVRANVRVTRMLSVVLAEQALLYTTALRLQMTDDFSEAAAAFVEKRSPQFHAR
jgi:enoyl-CoA hydratase/carnithine racemase